MDDEDFSALKETLRRFGPAPVPEGLRGRLERVARVPCAAGDRVLAWYTTAGAVAAGMVVALTVWQFAATPTRVPVSPQEMAARQRTVMEYEMILASR